MDGRTKLCDLAVLDILGRRWMKAKDLAEKHGCSVATIHSIWSRPSYRRKAKERLRGRTQ